MVAYSFKKRFVEPMESGTKTGTIRNLRKRPARHPGPNETIQHYTDLRSKTVRLIGISRCWSVRRIIICLREGQVYYPAHDVRVHETADLHDFARADGFLSWDALLAFWAEVHPGVYTFEGAHISWAVPGNPVDWLRWPSSFVPAGAASPARNTAPEPSEQETIRAWASYSNPVTES